MMLCLVGGYQQMEMHAASSFISLLHIAGSEFRQNAGNHLPEDYSWNLHQYAILSSLI